MLTYIEYDGEQIDRIGDALRLEPRQVIYLNANNVPYVVAKVRIDAEHDAQYVTVVRDLSRKVGLG